MKQAAAVCVALTAALTACSRDEAGAVRGPDSALPVRAIASRDSVERSIAEIVRRVDGSVGFAAIHLESGTRLSYNGGERYPMRSVYKFPIAVSVFRRVDAGTLKIDSTVVVMPADHAPNRSPLRDGARGRPVSVTIDSLLMLMIAESDNTASDVLLRLTGGAGAVTRDIEALDIRHVRVDRSERVLATAPYSEDDERDTATADAMADLLAAVHSGRGLSGASRRRLLAIMEQSRTGPNRIRALLPPGTVVAHKTGTGRPMTNDAGLATLPNGAGHVAIVAFVRTTSSDTAKSERVIAELARAAYEHFATERN